MVQTHELPSAWSTGVGKTSRTLVDPVETIGSPRDAPATAQNSTNSMFALAKGIIDSLGVPAGSGDGVTVVPRTNADLLRTLGSKGDAPASPGDNASAISLLKGIADILGA